ncbi:MAG TPA: sensor histidine kinase [Anaerovoracaceae bacterium]|nr:sensor histidine kinase [Anaerovoracaceae bacterium]
METNLSEDKVNNIIDRIKDSWVYLLVAYDTISLSTRDHQDCINKSIFDQDMKDSVTDESHNLEDDLKFDKLPLVFEGVEFGCVEFGYNYGNHFKYTEFLEHVSEASKARRNLPNCSLIPDGLIFISNSGDIWQNSIAGEMLARIEMGALEFTSVLFAKQDADIDIRSLMDSKHINIIEKTMAEFEITGITIPILIRDQAFGLFIIISDSTVIRKKDKELMSKAAIIKEIHHRVKNNLQTIASLLRLQMRRVNSRKVEKAFLESINRITSIALIHDELSKEGLDEINLKTTIINIMEIILTNMTSKANNITGEIIGADIYINANEASTLSLCITELIQNAVEHAFTFRKKGSIIVTLEETNENIIITVEDDGIGFNPQKSKASLGLEIIKMITVESLKGDFYIEGHTYGTKSKIIFPVKSVH